MARFLQCAKAAFVLVVTVAGVHAGTSMAISSMNEGTSLWCAGRWLSLQSLAKSDYDVYASVLSDWRLNGRVYRGYELVLEQRTVILREQWQMITAFKKGQRALQSDVARLVPTASEATIASFLAMDQRAVNIESHFPPELSVTVATKERIDEAMAGGYPWQGFYAAFPHATGILRLSRVGFDSTKREALVYIDCRSNLNVGAGHLVLLRLGDAGWKVFLIVGLWMS